jgi:GT2 family glycosyltransferase
MSSNNEISDDMTGPAPLVWIIILNWNGCRDTIDCVESVQKMDYPNYGVVVVDNGSSDGSEALLRERFPDVSIVQTGKNLGFAGGNNAGIRTALDQGADYVWVLNNDTVVDRRCLDFLVRAAEAEPRAGMVGNKIYYHHAPQTVWFAGGEVALDKGGLTRHTGKDCGDDPSYDRPGPSQYVTGCSLLARTAMIKDTGLMDENYFLYFEDVDWSLKAQQKGWNLIYEPRARIWHREGAQGQEGYSERFIYYSMRNRLYFMQRFAPRKMLHCHILQLKMLLFFMKSGLRRGLTAGLKPLNLTCTAYADYYLYNRMGENRRL